MLFRCLYNQEVNYANFDDLYVYEDDYGTNYSYDSDGKLILQKSDSGDAIRYTYNGPDITKISFEKNGTEKDNETYTYDNHHNLLTSTTKDGIVTSYSYPTTNRGMPNKITVTDSSGNLSSKVDYTYTAYDNYLATTKDENGEVTTYNYNTTKGLLNSVTDPLGNVTSYTYNANNDEPLSTSGTIDENNNATVTYGYDSAGRVTSISPAGTTYGFTYDQFGRTTGTSVAGQTLSTVAYNSNGTIATSTYGNGTVHAYSYDSMDRVTEESYDGTTAFRYSYNSQGQLGSLEDVAEDEVWVYGYDLAGRLTEEDGSNRVSIRYAYNDQNNTSAYKVYKRGTKLSAADYTYSDVGLLTGVKTNNGDPNFTFGYDGLNRITKEGHALTSGNVATNYTYHSSTQGQSGRIASLNYQLTPTGGSASTLRSGISYQYNANGQITSITENNKTHSFEYDGLGRLTRENDEDRSVTICYNYDSNGNILSKVFYPYTTGALTSATSTVPYTYATSWGDQLLTYNGGSTILYDQIGNPLSYNGYTFTWQKGRQLKTANDGTNSYRFDYNADGLRTWKTKNNKSTQYTYASGLLVSMTDGTDTLNFTYDPDGIALGVNLNGTDYYYLYNAQGDVIALYDSTGTIVTEYKYDSWGKLLSTTGSKASTIGTLNPLRYRGYFYDTDLSLYLLETRYYDPEIGRFINADGVVDNQDVSTYNLYAYCANDPVNNKDEEGERVAAIIAGAVIGGIIGGVTTWAKGGSKKAIVKSAAIGALKGAATSAIGGWVSTAVKGAKGVALVATIYGMKNVVSNRNSQKRQTAKSSSKAKGVGSNKKVHNKLSTKQANQRYTNSRSFSKNTTSTVRKIAQTLKPTKSDLIAFSAGATNGIVSSAFGSVGENVFVKLNPSISNLIAEIAYDSVGEINASAFEGIVKQSAASLFPGEGL